MPSRRYDPRKRTLLRVIGTSALYEKRTLELTRYDNCFVRREVARLLRVFLQVVDFKVVVSDQRLVRCRTVEMYW